MGDWVTFATVCHVRPIHLGSLSVILSIISKAIRAATRSQRVVLSSTTSTSTSARSPRLAMVAAQEWIPTFKPSLYTGRYSVLCMLCAVPTFW